MKNKIIIGICIAVCTICITGLLWQKPVINENHEHYYINNSTKELAKLLPSNQLEKYKNEIRSEYRYYQELQDRKFNFFLSLLAIAIAVGSV